MSMTTLFLLGNVPVLQKCGAEVKRGRRRLCSSNKKTFTIIHKLTKTCITYSVRELVNSLCRDGADTPIVCVH